MGVSKMIIEGKVTDVNSKLKDYALGSSTYMVDRNKMATIKLRDKPIKKLRTISKHDGKLYVQIELDVDVILTTNEGAQLETIQRTDPYYVTSDKQLLHFNDQILKQDFQMPRLDSNMNSPRWTKLDLEEWLTSPNSVIDAKQVFDSVKAQIKSRLELPTDSFYDLMTVWCIGTYFSRLFEFYPYLDFFGSKGSGKTKAITIAIQIAYNGELISSITPSAVYRTIEQSGSTLGIDEAEYLKKPKADDNVAKNMLALLKGAFKMDNRIKISIQTPTGWMPYSMDCGTCLALGHIRELDDVLLERVITIPMRKALDPIKANEDVDIDSHIWSQLRSMCYRLLLENYQSVFELKKKPFISKLISNRELNQIWKPMITLARFFESEGVIDLEKRLESVISESHTHKVQNTLDQDLDSQFAEAIIEKFEDEKTALKCVNNEANKPVADWYKQVELLEVIKLKIETVNWLNAHNIGPFLDRLGLARKKITPNGKCVFIDLGILSNLCKRYDLDSTKISSRTSQTSRTDTKLDGFERDERDKRDEESSNNEDTQNQEQNKVSETNETNTNTSSSNVSSRTSRDEPTLGNSD
jgi:hypothetical protein